MFGSKSTQAEQIRQLTIENQRLQGKMQAMLVERNFWVEQGRNLQNQLQTWQRMYADLFDQLGRGVVTEQSIADNLALASEELRQPVTGIAAVEALVASQKPDTQGKYTQVGGRDDKRITKQ